METLNLLLSGFATALQPSNLLFAFLGSMFGTILGILPGIGPAAGTAILIPITFVLNPTSAIIMLSAIYYGAMYGGTITSILINTPGEPSSAITCLDGYEMAKQGRAGVALAIAAIGSFIGGTMATVGLVCVALPLARLALRFGPAEIFALMVFGLSLVTGLAGRSMTRALMSAAIGLLIATIGVDTMIGGLRFTFGRPELLDGFNFVAVVMGLFGVSEVFLNLEKPPEIVFKNKLTSLIPTIQDLRDSAGAITRSSLIGFAMGLIPGIGSVIPTIMAYITEKKMSKHPEKFGKGAIEGVAAAETANNAYANAALIPLFTLGLPGAPTIAILMGAFMMNGLIPGPLLFQEHGDLVWAVIASLYVGNVILLILNLPLIPLWVSLLRIPYALLFAVILGFCVIGAYTLSNSLFDIGTMLGFGVLGYALKKLDFPLAPMVLTLILGPLMEKSMRQALGLSMGDPSIFVTSPLSLVLLIMALLFTLGSFFGLGSGMKGTDSHN